MANMNNQRRHVWMSLVGWSMAGWISAIAVVTDRLARSDPFGWAWQIASRAVFFAFLTPICAMFLVRAWRALVPMAPRERIGAALLVLPTAVAALFALALAFQTFIGVI